MIITDTLLINIIDKIILEDKETRIDKEDIIVKVDKQKLLEYLSSRIDMLPTDITTEELTRRIRKIIEFEEIFCDSEFKLNSKIKIAIVGVGCCAASLVEGIYYYSIFDENKYIPPGLMHWRLGNYLISDIGITCAFDIDKRKVGKNLLSAIFQPPNCTKPIWSDRRVMFNDNLDPIVLKGPVLDGVAEHMKPYFQVDENQNELTKEEIVSILKETQTQIIISYLPVGSKTATDFWANIALESKCSFINAIPQFIASNQEWADKFRQANLPLLGDDVKSIVGSTIVNRALIQLIQDRGGKIVNSIQINIGGNTDFKNMSSEERLRSKKISKIESVSSLIPEKDRENTYVWAGPNGAIDCLNDNKISYMKIDFKIFGNIDCSMDIKLDVQDSPNSGGIIVDAIRIAKLALDRKIGGPLIGPSAWLFKHPIRQYPDEIARKMTEDFINNNNNNGA